MNEKSKGALLFAGVWFAITIALDFLGMLIFQNSLNVGESIVNGLVGGVIVFLVTLKFSKQNKK